MLRNWMKWLPYIVVERLAVRYCMKIDLDGDIVVYQAFSGRSLGINKKA